MNSASDLWRRLTPNSGARSARPSGRLDTRDRWPLISMIALMVLTFALGGGSRSDIQSLLLLRPLAFMLLAVGLFSLHWSHVQRHRTLFAIALSSFVLVFLHLIPLPVALWTALPGRGIVVDLQQAAGIVGPWRPLTLTPSAAWNAAFSLTIPLAALVLGSQLSRAALARLLPAMLAVGAISAIVGLLQLMAGGHGHLYFYRHTNYGSPVGLFANANHQAVFLAALLPMLAVWATIPTKRGAMFSRKRVWAALLSAAFIIPLVVVVGSRAGVIATAIALMAIPLLLHSRISAPGRTKLGGWWRISVAFCMVSAAALIALMFNFESAVPGTLGGQQDRIQFWPVIAKAGLSYFPFGSGAGSFVEMYKLHEPAEFLSPTYLNHAHNDWLEVFATLGLPGVLLLTGAVLWIFRRAFRGFALIRRERETSGEVQRACLGGVILAIFALASIVDYPVRTPALMLMVAVAALWLSAGTNRSSAAR